MNKWPSQEILRLLKIEHPLIQAPMAGADTPDLAVAVSQAGGLGSLGCALLTPDQVRNAWRFIRSKTDKPVNLNFFCHQQKEKSAAQQERWKQKLLPYYAEFGLDPEKVEPAPARAPFDEDYCAVVEEIKPAVVSFHFGLPEKTLLNRVRKTGAVILSSATTVEEALWLEANGCDAIIAQGIEAGGHRGMFLTADLSAQPETAELVRQIVAAVSLPVIAAGGIADAKEIVAMLGLGAAAVQVGTAYLFCPEAQVAPLHRAALGTGAETAITNIFSGRPARGIVNRLMKEIGPMSADAPDFPHAAHFINPLRRASEKAGKADLMQMWAGTRRKAHALTAGELTKALYTEALRLL